MTLRSYPEYRDSGLPWLGEIPAHWEMRRNGRLFTQRNETGFPELPVLEVSLRTGVRVRDMDNVARKQVMSDFAKYKRAAQGDIAYNMMRMWQGAVGIAPVDGLISPAYVVAKPRPEIDSRYFAYLFRVGAYMREVNKFSHGIVADRNRLYWEDFKQMPSIFPPREEQEKIVAYLSARDRQIARLIRAKQRLIELLTEQKQAIIHRAVTRGLDPDAKMKQTGLDWLSEVPEGWEVKSLRSCFSSVVSGLWGEDPSPNSVHEHVVCVRVADFDVATSSVSDSRLTIRSIPKYARKTRQLLPGDLLIEKSGGGDSEPVGRVVMFNLEQEAVCSNFVSRIRANKRLVKPRFLMYVLIFLQSSRQIVPSIKQTTGIQNLDQRHYFSTHFGVPALKEQAEIVHWLDDEFRKIDAAIERARREIDLIREYRTRLVSDVVTGRLDVRGTKPPKVEDIEDPPGLEEPLPPIPGDLVEESRTAP